MVNFDRVADIYDATRGLPESETRRIFDKMKLMFRGVNLVLDAGVGTGRFAKRIEKEGVEVVGIDISLNMITIAEDKGIENLIIADLHQVPLRERCVDASLLVHVLHLVKDWKLVLGELCRTTKKRIISLIEITEGPSVRAEYLHLREMLGYPTHRFNSGERGLAASLEPDMRCPALNKRQKYDFIEDVTHFEKLRSSITWDVPTETHSKIMKLIREHEQSHDQYIHRTCEVVYWQSNKLLTFIARSSQDHQ